MSGGAASRRFDFIALGRAAVDFYGEQVGGRLEDMASFAKYLGGCPANISVGAARLGLKPAMLTRVGDEHMGRFVRETLAAEGVDVSHVKTDPRRLTALVVLGIRDRNTFPLIFYRENCADMAVDAEDFDAAFIASARALIVTGTHFSTAHVDRTSRRAIAYARAAGTEVVLDIDYRPVLWGLTGHGLGEERFVASTDVTAHLQSIAPLCDLIVGTEEEIHIAGGSTDTLAAVRALRAVTAATIVVKRGAQGCTVFTGAIPDRFADAIDCPGFPVEVFNVLGAGDGFMAGLMRGWLRGETWETSSRYANACGALVVSRHGCAPAMPSWTELDCFLARSDRPDRLHEDTRTAYLHRVTAGRRRRAEIFALAFDHRRQFDDLAAQHGQPLARVAAFKRLIAAALDAAGDPLRAGAIVDERFGRDCLHEMAGTHLWVARPVELPGAVPLEFEAGDDLSTTLRAWPAGQVAKCLIQYHPDDPEPLRRAQVSQLRRLQQAAHATGHEWLLEIVPPTERGIEDGGWVAGAASQFYAAGLLPEWWKLPPMRLPQAWRAVGAVIAREDPYCRGILVLGLDAEETALAESFAAARTEPRVAGFAVGRHIFWSAAEDWFAGRCADAEATERIAQRYRAVVAAWEAAAEAPAVRQSVAR